MKTFADQIRSWVEAPYVVLGTDGYGRSDTRAALRRFFEVDRAHIALAALEGLAEAGSPSRASPWRRGDREARHRSRSAQPGDGVAA